jgi:hypothetical protein
VAVSQGGKVTDALPLGSCDRAIASRNLKLQLTGELGTCRAFAIFSPGVSRTFSALGQTGVELAVSAHQTSGFAHPFCSAGNGSILVRPIPKLGGTG